MGPRLSLSIAIAVALAGCSSQSYLAIMPAVVNDTHNRTLRRDLLAFGAGDLCKEIGKRSVPVKLGPDDPAIGRFFIQRCDVKTLPGGDLFAQIDGTGYAYSNLTKRIGFHAAAAVQLEQDFRLDGATAYVYFRPASPPTHKLDPLMVELEAFPETPISGVLVGGTPRGFVKQVGEGLFEHVLGEGFTVVRQASGAIAFTLGTNEPGDEPMVAFEPTSASGAIYANERVEIHAGEREYFGPIDLTEDGKALDLTLCVDGAPGIDVQVVAREVGDAWLQQYLSTAAAGPAPGAPVFDDVVAQQPATTPYRRTLRLPKGYYFVVLDHTDTAGKSGPPRVPNDDRAALVGVAIAVTSAR